jgi:endonuclease/exonuclease/phosphatase family metal-dependent hydrolase
MRLKIVFILLCLGGQLTAQTVNVMTYNIRYDNPGDGINQWSSRKEKVFDLIKKYNPDVFGVQEALHHQLEDIKRALPEYSFIGAGRDDGARKGEYSAIFFKSSQYQLIQNQTFWLSETPYIPGSKSWDAAITRVATWAKMTDKKTGKVFLIINTHFDHIGKEARVNSASLLKKKATEIVGTLPVIITGDFNCTRDEAPYKTMMEKDGLVLTDPAPANPEGTFCNFGVNSQPCRPIDYVFHTSHWKSSDYKVIRDNDGSNYPSDHLPVMVQLYIK